nr:thioesterase family protein [Brevibacterium sp. XM4083]
MDREVPGFIANRLQEAQWREALHMVEAGEATVEQIDRSITDGPGLRWPFQGPMLTFHLAGGEGGMAHMLDHFGPSLKSPWTRLDAPELTPALRDAVVAGCEDESAGRSIADLVSARDAGIVALRRLTADLDSGGGATAAATQAAAQSTTAVTGDAAGPGVVDPAAAGTGRQLSEYRTAVREEWIDYNGHLSEAFYVLVFGFATDAIMDELGLDAEYRKATGCSLYTVESHVRYLDEVSLGSTLIVRPQLVAAGAKKLHLAYEMIVDGRVVATEEILALHVDQTADAATEFPPEIAATIAKVARSTPEWSGRRVG